MKSKQDKVSCALPKYAVFTGGGSAGHVTPNVAVMDVCLQQGWQVAYIGSHQGIEQKIISSLNIPFYSIKSGKLRRYFSWQNFIDPFKVFLGIFQAFILLKRLKPSVVFSKGGFVAFPVVVAAWLNHITVIAHESDLKPGLANRLSFPFVKKICIAYAEGRRYFSNADKLIVTGTPIRQSLFAGDAGRGRQFCGFTKSRPTLLVLGGGLGSKKINSVIYKLLNQITQKYNLIHLCGQGKTATPAINLTYYKQFEYAHETLADLLACADLVISRAGANAVYELIALQKPHILIPLSKQASRGEQIANAEYFAAKGLSYVIKEEALMPAVLFKAINDVYQNRFKYLEKLAAYPLKVGTKLVYQVLKEALNRPNSS